MSDNDALFSGAVFCACRGETSFGNNGAVGAPNASPSSISDRSPSEVGVFSDNVSSVVASTTEVVAKKTAMRTIASVDSDVIEFVLRREAIEPFDKTGPAG